jgi:hypothetical protein
MKKFISLHPKSHCRFWYGSGSAYGIWTRTKMSRIRNTGYNTNNGYGTETQTPKNS